MTSAPTGLPVTLDGPGGAVKTTTARHLTDLLARHGHRVHATTQPSRGELGQIARHRRGGSRRPSTGPGGGSWAYHGAQRAARHGHVQRRSERGLLGDVGRHEPRRVAEFGGRLLALGLVDVDQHDPTPVLDDAPRVARPSPDPAPVTSAQPPAMSLRRTPASRVAVPEPRPR